MTLTFRDHYNQPIYSLPQSIKIVKFRINKSQMKYVEEKKQLVKKGTTITKRITYKLRELHIMYD